MVDKLFETVQDVGVVRGEASSNASLISRRSEDFLSASLKKLAYKKWDTDKTLSLGGMKLWNLGLEGEIMRQ